MTDLNTAALNAHQNEQDAIDSKVQGVTFNDEVYLDLLLCSIDDNFDHKFVDLANDKFPIGSEEWKNEATRVFMAWTERYKQEAQHEAEQEALAA